MPVNFNLEFISGTTYDLILYNFVRGTIIEGRLITDDGSADVTMEIDGVGITGMNGDSVTDLGTTLTATANNTLDVGGKLTITMDNVVDAIRITGSIKIMQ